jgi:hypothetical protein
MMATLLSVLLSIAAITILPLPEGAQLHIRLTTTEHLTSDSELSSSSPAPGLFQFFRALPRRECNENAPDRDRGCFLLRSAAGRIRLLESSYRRG